MSGTQPPAPCCYRLLVTVSARALARLEDGGSSCQAAVELWRARAQALRAPPLPQEQNSPKTSSGTYLFVCVWGAVVGKCVGKSLTGRVAMSPPLHLSPPFLILPPPTCTITLHAHTHVLYYKGNQAPLGMCALACTHMRSYYHQVQEPALANRRYSGAVADFTTSCILAYECGYSEDSLREQLQQVCVPGRRILCVLACGVDIRSEHSLCGQLQHRMLSVGTFMRSGPRYVSGSDGGMCERLDVWPCCWHHTLSVEL